MGAKSPFDGEARFTSAMTFIGFRRKKEYASSGFGWLLTLS
jgi:hypothetical protein